MYASVTLLKQLYPMVGSITTVQSADVVLFLSQAEALVNAKLATVYTVPVTPTPPLLEALTVDIAMYGLLAKRFFTQKQMNESVWPDRFKEAKETLDELAAGKATLVNSDGTVVDASQSDGAFKSSTLNYQPTFTEDTEVAAFIDPDKIDAIRGDRNW